MQENNIEEQQQGAASEQRLTKSKYLERAGDQGQQYDLAGLIAEELRRKDAHIARLEALLRQTASPPTAHQPIPEVFAPLVDGTRDTANVAVGTPILRRGAMAYDTPSALPTISPTIYDTLAPLPGGLDTSPDLSLAYKIPGQETSLDDTPPVTRQAAPIRLSDMRIEHSPIAQTVMQAAMQRPSAHVPAFEPTLRFPARAARQAFPRLPAADTARPTRRAMAAGLALAAFVATIGVLQTRASRQEAATPGLSATGGASARTGRKYLLAAPAAVNLDTRPYASRPLEIRPLEILPADPEPATSKPSAHSPGSVYTAAAPARRPRLAAVAHSFHSVKPPVYAVPAHHPVTPLRVFAAAPAERFHKSAAPLASHLKSAMPTTQAENDAVIAEVSENRRRVNISTLRSETPASEEAVTSRAEILPDNAPRLFGDDPALEPRPRYRRRYRRSQVEADERRGNAYRYGETTRRPFDYDAEFTRHPAPGYDEKADAWIDKLPQ